MQKILIGTTNEGKLKEIAKFLKDLPVTFVSLADLQISHEVEEIGKTYKENAEQKAREYAKLSGLPTIADDGGFEIHALDGAPGLKSHRWLGQQTTEDDLFNYMKHLGKTLPENDRNARFVTVVAFAQPDGKVLSYETCIDGIITKEPSPKREKGYPYRSFFYIPALKKYYFDQDFSQEEREKYHHRYRALQKLKQSMVR